MVDIITDLISSLTRQTYLGNTLLQYVIFFGIVIAMAVIGKIIYYFTQNHVRKLTSRTKSDFDDILIDMLEKPLIFALIVVGIWVGTQFLSLNNAVQEFLSSFFGVVITLLITWFGLKLVDGAMKKLLRPLVDKTDTKLDDQLIPLVSKLLKVIILAFVVIIILENFGYDVTAMIAGLGIGGLAIAFAAKETISDAFGGFSIITSRPFQTGDFIITSDVTGTVEEVGIRYSRIRNLDKRIVTVPNNKLANSVIENVSSAPARKISLHLGLTYDTSVKKMKKAEEIITKIINSRKDCEKDPKLYFHEFKDYSLDLFVIYFITDKNNWLKVNSEVNYAIKEAFDKEGLDFAFPTQTVHVKK